MKSRCSLWVGREGLVVEDGVTTWIVLVHSVSVAFYFLPTAAAPSVRAKVKTALSYRNDTIIKSLFFVANKMKTMLKLFWPPLFLNSRILGLI